MKPDNEICGVLFKHEKDVYSYWSDFTLTESEKRLSWVFYQSMKQKDSQYVEQRESYWMNLKV